MIPFLLFVPDGNKGNHPALVYLHPEGKVTEASPELIEMDTKFPRSVYSYKNAAGNLRIVSSYESLGSLVDWGFEE